MGHHSEEDGTVTPGEHPAPDEDYIVGGTGVVRALQYVLGDRSDPNRRHSGSVPGTPISGPITPRERPESSAGLGVHQKQSEKERKGKAKEMSKNLLLSARKIRSRLQPAIAREAREGDEMSYRRLLFLDQTLRNMVARFEEEYPETRVPGAKAEEGDVDTGSMASIDSLPSEDFKLAGDSRTANPGGATGDVVAKEDDIDGEMDEQGLRPGVGRKHSDVSLYSRKLAEEEGRVHRLGSHLRRELVDSSSDNTTHQTPATPSTTASTTDPGNSAPAPANATHDPTNAPLAPITSPVPQSTNISDNPSSESRLAAISAQLEALTGEQLRSIYEAEGSRGWAEVLERVGANLSDLRRLQERDPEAWEVFRESQVKARMNARLGEGGSRLGEGDEGMRDRG